MISNSEFIDWRSNPVTKAFLTACAERIDEAKDYLSRSAGLNQQEDNFYRGLVHAYRELFDFRIDDLEGATDGD